MTHPGPTHPGPSGPTSPSPRTGHLPISDPREARPAHAPEAASPEAVVAAGVGQLPTLGMVIRDAERLLAQALSVLERWWDPTSGPQQDGGMLPSTVDMLLGAARTEVRIALLHLGDVADLGLPPVGSAVHLTTGPTGESRSPGYAAAVTAAASESGGAVYPSQATSSPARHPGWPTSGPRPAAAPVAAGGSLGGFATPEAGVLSGAAPIGAPFTLPAAKRWSW